MSGDKKHLASQCWKVGTEAMNKQNWPYAVDMFSKCAKFVPDNLVYRQTLWGSISRLYNNNKSGAGMAVLKLMGVKGRIKKAQMQKDWAALDAATLEGMCVNPWDIGLLADGAAACKNLGYLEVAVFYYQKAIEFEPNHKENCRALAELLETRGEYTQASGLWDRISKLDPLDGEARTRANQAATKHVIDRGGYEDADSSKGVMADHEVQKRLKTAGGKPGEVADGPGMSEEADLQRAVRKEPDNKDNYLKLAQFYRRSGKLDEAQQFYTKALEVSGGDPNIRELVEDCDLDLMRKNVSLAKERAISKPNEEAIKKKFEELKRELRLREMEVLRVRVERHPQNLQIKYQLADCFMAEKKYAEAIPLYQQASQDSRLETKAFYQMGMCFIQEKKYPLARRQFEKAAPKLNAHETKDLFLDVHYWLGRLGEAASDNENAESHYSEVLAVDYGYKDTLARLEKLQGGA